MPTRFEAYRMRDGVTPLSEDYFNGVFADIDTRIADLEVKRADWNQVLVELTEFGLQRIDVLVGPAMAEVNAMLAELRTKRDELVAAIGNVGNLATSDALQGAVDDLQGQINTAAETLRDRAHHTGVQGVDTIDGLQGALEGLAGGVAARQVALVYGGVLTAGADAMAGHVYDVDTTAGPFSLAMPPGLPVGARVGVRDVAFKFAEKPLTLVGERFEGANENMVIDIPLRGVFVCKGAARGWELE